MESKVRLIKIIVLTNQQLLLSEIEEVQSELGEPDCRLVNPFVFKDDKSLEPFLDGYSKEKTFMISSDKIITLAQPTPTLLEEYQDITK